MCCMLGYDLDRGLFWWEMVVMARKILTFGALRLFAADVTKVRLCDRLAAGWGHG